MDEWDQVAPAWESNRQGLFENQRAVSEWLVRHVDPHPGQTVLELASGPGETGFLVAERIGPSGRLIQTDGAPGMVEAARRGAEAQGLSNVEHRVMDAQAIDLPDGSVDGVLSRYALMLMPQPDRCVEGVRRVLKPGGRFAYAVWGPPDRNPWAALLGMAVMQHGHTMAGNPFEPGGIWSLGTADPNRALLDGAGFSDVRIEELPGEFRSADFDEYWTLQTSVSGSMAVLIGSLSPAERDAIRETVAGNVEQFHTADGLRIPSLSLGVTARA